MRPTGLLLLVLLFLTCLATPALAAGPGRVGPQAVPTINVDDVTVTEGDAGAKIAVFTVSLSAPAATDVGFWVGTAELGAIGNDDFQHYYSSPYTIPAGQRTYTLNLVIFGDTVPETDESFEVRLEAVTNANVGKGVGIGTILNDDGGAAPALYIGDLWIEEGNAGGKTANFTVQLSQPAATDVSFSVASSNGTASAGSDYTAVSLANQVIPAGQLRKTVAVTIAGDTTTEKNETFKLTLSNASGATVGRGQATGTIGNDDNVSAVKIYVDDVYVQERNSGPQTMTFYVRLSKAAASGVSFDLRTEDSSASASSDYIAIDLAGQTIPAGQTTKAFTVTVNGDAVPEPDERFILTISNISTNAALEYSDPHGVVTVPNDDAVLSISDASMVEGDSGTTRMEFTVSLTAPVNDQVRFHYLTCDGSATVADGDYWATGDAYYTYLPGGATGMKVGVDVQGDFAVEGDETFCVNITDLSGVVGGDLHAVGTILNDDAPPPTVSVGDASVAEGDSSVQSLMFPITFSSPPNQTVVVAFHTESCGGSAEPNSDAPYEVRDYIAFVDGQIWLNAGTTSTILSVGVNGDTEVEPDEQMCLKLDSATGATLGIATGIGTILNDDVAPAISINDASVVEGNGGLAMMTFTVSLNKPQPMGVFFDIATHSGTATPEVDFATAYSMGAAIRAGQTSMEFSVFVNGDTVVEGNETFAVHLTNVQGVAVARDSGRGTIVNDDKAVLSIADATVVEGNVGTRTATFLVTLSQALPAPVTFDIATVDGSATAGTDYVARNQASRLLDAGRTRAVFEVAIHGDSTLEPDETFGVSLANVTGATLGDGTAVGTIENDDAAPMLAALGSFDLGETIAAGDGPLGADDAQALRLARAADAICTRAGNPAILAVRGLGDADALGDLAAAVNSGAGNVLSTGSCREDPRYLTFVAPGAQGPGLLVSSVEVRPGVPRVELRSLVPALFITRGGGHLDPTPQADASWVEARIHAADGRFVDVAILALRSASAAPAQGAARTRRVAAAVAARKRAHPRMSVVVVGEVDGLSPMLIDLGTRAGGARSLWVDPALLSAWPEAAASRRDPAVLLLPLP